MAVGVPVKVTANDIDAGSYVIVQVEMKDHTSAGKAKVTWSDTQYLEPPVVDEVPVTRARFDFRQRTKPDVSGANRTVTVTVSTSESKSDDFTIRKR